MNTEFLFKKSSIIPLAINCNYLVSFDTICTQISQIVSKFSFHNLFEQDSKQVCTLSLIRPVRLFFYNISSLLSFHIIDWCLKYRSDQVISCSKPCNNFPAQWKQTQDPHQALVLHDLACSLLNVLSITCSIQSQPVAFLEHTKPVPTWSSVPLVPTAWNPLPSLTPPPPHILAELAACPLGHSSARHILWIAAFPDHTS